MQPQTDVCELLPMQMLAGSVTGSIEGGSGPGYGGVDEGGTQDPSVKGDWGDIWD